MSGHLPNKFFHAGLRAVLGKRDRLFHTLLDACLQLGNFLLADSIRFDQSLAADRARILGLVVLQFVDFTMLGMDQIVNQAAKFCFMTGNQGTVPMVLRTQGGTGNGVAAQHSQSLEALFYHIPGLSKPLAS